MKASFTFLSSSGFAIERIPDLSSYYDPGSPQNTVVLGKMSTLVDLAPVPVGADLQQAADADRFTYSAVSMNGHPGIDSPASAFMIGSADQLAAGDQFTAFLVFQTLANPGAQQLIWGRQFGNLQWSFFCGIGAGRVGFYAANLAGQVASGAVNDGVPHVLIGRYDGVNTTLFVDGVTGVPIAQLGAVPDSTDRVSIGCLAGNVAGDQHAANALIATLGRFGTVARALTDPQVAQLSTSLSAMYS